MSPSKYPLENEADIDCLEESLRAGIPAKEASQNIDVPEISAWQSEHDRTRLVDQILFPNDDEENKHSSESSFLGEDKNES
jgi:hypothetical protein